MRIRICQQDNLKGSTVFENAHPFLCLISGDNEALQRIAGTSWVLNKSKQKRICRICCTLNCVHDLRWASEPETRDDKLMSITALRGEQLEARKFEHACANTESGSRKRFQYSEFDRKTIDLMKEWNIAPGKQWLYKFVAWQSMRKILSFHRMLVPDVLHTVFLGIVLNCIHWTHEILYGVAKLDAQNFQKNMAILDDHLSTFPYVQSFQFFPNVRFRKGISDLMTVSKSVSSGTSFAHGSIEAWKLQNLLLQILFSVDAQMLPSTVQWCIQHKTTYKWNVFKTVTNALTSTLEFVFSCKARSILASSIPSLQQLSSTARTHVMLLWCCRKDLLRTADVKAKAESKKKVKRLRHLLLTR